MNYDLAKELKDAGFPQKGLWGIVYRPEKINITKSGQRFVRQEEYRTFLWKAAPSFLKSTYEPLVLPTLSELIEACAKEFGTVILRVENDGSADAWIEGTIGPSGSTPEEAVVRLWLALNQKNNLGV